MAMQETTDSSAPVTSLSGAAETVEGTMLEVWTSFVSHVPLLAAGLVVVLVTWLLARLVEKYSSQWLSGWAARESLRELLTRLASITVWTVGLLLAAMVVFPGLTPTKALGGLGLLSVAVGFAFRDIFENFFAGILILWRFPFENRDLIECQGVLGRVENVTIRNTNIRKLTGELVVMPNSMLFKNPVEVLTYGETRRVTVMTGVAYDVDVEEAVDVISRALESCQTIDRDQPVQVFPKAFGASSIDIEVTWWTKAEQVEIRRSRAEVVTTVKKALDDAGIEIPFPYRTLTFKEPLPLRQTADREDAAAPRDAAAKEEAGEKKDAVPA